MYLMAQEDTCAVLRKGKEVNEAKLSENKLHKGLAFIFHTSFIIMLVTLFWDAATTYTVRSNMQEDDWLINIKTARQFGANITTDDLSSLWAVWRDSVYPNLKSAHSTERVVCRVMHNMSMLILFISGVFRLLQHLEFQPLLSTLTGFLKDVMKELIHTLLILIIVLVGFAIFGHIVIARVDANFRTLPKSYTEMW